VSGDWRRDVITIPLWTQPGGPAERATPSTCGYDSRGSGWTARAQGWSLGRIHLRYRCKPDLRPDGAPAAVYLDGLGCALASTAIGFFWVSGTYGAGTNRDLWTEIRDFSQILLHQPRWNMTASWFEVHFRQGRPHYEYGNTQRQIPSVWHGQLYPRSCGRPSNHPPPQSRVDKATNLIVGYSTNSRGSSSCNGSVTRKDAKQPVLAYNYKDQPLHGAPAPWGWKSSGSSQAPGGTDGTCLTK